VGKANFAFAGLLALGLTVACVAVAVTHGLPIRDPDGVIVPMYIQLPIICLIAWLIDVLPRAVWRMRKQTAGFRRLFADVVAERWESSHIVFAVTGLGAWYICYATFRNLKSYVPFVWSGDAHPAPASHVFDDALDKIDRAIWFGHEPANVLHAAFGNDVAAHFFSFIYVAWIVLIPVTLAIALVWTRDPARGSWYVTAIAVDWVLGAAAYYALPTLGPIYTDPGDFADIAHTYTTTLESNLWTDRVAVLADPHATHAVQTIAAFPSLHVGMMVSVCTFVTLAGMRRWIRIVAWAFLVITVIGTLYLGWHFFVDAVAGGAIGAGAVWIAAIATGNHVGLKPQLVDRGRYEEPAAERTASLSQPL
jgi:hypothetical protein